MRRVLLCLILLAGCGQRTPAEPPDAETPAAAPAPPAIPAPPPASQWLGRWDGPEGLFMQVDPAGEGRYRVTLKDSLDDQAFYVAEAQGDALVFMRKNERLAIRPGPGTDTGFKWLAEKTNCLILKPGLEGYCRG